MFIGFLVVFAACTKHDVSVETRFIASPETLASPALQSIDSLMWQRPDSALAILLPWFDTCCRDALNASPQNASPDDATDSMARRNHCVSTGQTFDNHYAHLLLAELLYKNDYQQSNRVELQQAVVYFDSLVQQAPPVPPLKRGKGDSRTTPNENSNLIFLSARAHYINGVGYYERDSVVEACGEYLKALETMEGHFNEKELVGKKAVFMTYTYNRLGDMFSEQFMMESSISCYEQALVYCLIEPTSPTGVSNSLYRLGKQYDKMDMFDKARQYYCQALETISNSDNPVYRNIVSSKAICDYQLGLGLEQSLNMLSQVLSETTDEKEQSVRLLVIGIIFFEEMMYDSAIYYLKPLCDNRESATFQIDAANYLRIIYDSLGDHEKSNDYMRLSACQSKTEGQNKALVSQLDHLFQNYQNQKLEKKAIQEQQAAVLRTIKMAIPIAIIAVSILVVIIRKRNKKKLAKQNAEAQLKLKERERHHLEELKRQQKESKQRLHESETIYVKKIEVERQRHEEVLEAERLTHKMQQAAIAGRLKRSNQEVRELQNQIKQWDGLAAKTENAPSFEEEPVCRLIMERMNDGQFKAQMDYRIYKAYALNDKDLRALREAADRHFNWFTVRLSRKYPQLTRIDLDYCCLYLLGLTNADVSALMQRAYNTVNERSNKIKRILGSESAIFTTLQFIASEAASH